MTERQLRFIDVDENFLVLWLKEDRVQLRVVDSRPELEAGELRAFASVLFAEYVGGPLVARLEAARDQLAGLRDRLGQGSADEIAAYESSLRAVGEVAAAIAGVRKAIAPPAEPVSSPASQPSPAGPAPRKRRAREPRGPRWGWVTSSSCRPR